LDLKDQSAPWPERSFLFFFEKIKKREWRTDKGAQIKNYFKINYHLLIINYKKNGNY